MNFQNPQQIAATLGLRTIEVVSIIRIAKIQSHKEGIRAGLYDLAEVQAAIERVKSAPTQG